MSEYTNEAYQKGETVVVVHERRGGQVYCHRQKWDDTITPMCNWFRVPEPAFDEDMATHGIRIDVNQLPAATMTLSTRPLSPVADHAERERQTVDEGLLWLLGHLMKKFGTVPPEFAELKTLDDKEEKRG